MCGEYCKEIFWNERTREQKWIFPTRYLTIRTNNCEVFCLFWHKNLIAYNVILISRNLNCKLIYRYINILITKLIEVAYTEDKPCSSLKRGSSPSSSAFYPASWSTIPQVHKLRQNGGTSCSGAERSAELVQDWLVLFPSGDRLGARRSGVSSGIGGLRRRELIRRGVTVPLGVLLVESQVV